MPEAEKPKSKALNRLTARKVETLKTEGYHHDGGGLYLRVLRSSRETNSVARSWLFRYRVNGKEHWLGLGSAGIVPLADARVVRDELRIQRYRGHDPFDARQAAKVAAKIDAGRSITFEKCADEYIAAHGSLPFPQIGFVRLKDFIGPGRPIPISRSAWWDGVRRGILPQPVKLGRRVTAWRVQDIQALIEKGGW